MIEHEIVKFTSFLDSFGINFHESNLFSELGDSADRVRLFACNLSFDS